MQFYAKMEDGEMKIVDEFGHEINWSSVVNNFAHAMIPVAPLPIPAVAPKMLFADFIPEYLLMQKYQVRQNTYEIYKITAETHIIPYFRKLNISVQEVTTLHIQHYMNVKRDEGLSAATLKKHFTIINGTLSYALYNLHMILYNPADRVRRLPVEKRMFTYYDVPLIRELLKAVKGHPLETVIILASHYGLRRSEVLGLRWGAINFTNGTVSIQRTVVKTNKSSIDRAKTKTEDSYRTMPLMDDVRKYLQQLYIKQKNMTLILKDKYIENDLICKKDNGEPFRPDYVTRGFKKIISPIKLPDIRFHDLRHSAASILINDGHDLLDISYWLGHADLNTTKRYAHLEYVSKVKMANCMNNKLGLAALYNLKDIEADFYKCYNGSISY